MPAYEYICDQCASRFEKRQKMSEAPLETCPACGGHVHRLISGGAGAITKASGHSHSEAPACASGDCCGSGMGACGGGFCQN